MHPSTKGEITEVEERGPACSPQRNPSGTTIIIIADPPYVMT